MRVLTCLMLLVSSTPRERLIELARMAAGIGRVDGNAEDQEEKDLVAHIIQE